MDRKRQTDAQKLDILIPKAMDYICEQIQQKMPETGGFRKFFVCFTYPGTGYEALLWVEHNVSERDGNGRLTAGMREAGSDKVVQHYMAKGTKEELMQWLNTSANGAQLRSSYEQLKSAVDQFE